MEPGRRRLIWGITIAVAGLVLGRWTATFATARLWEARVSEAAALVGTRFALLSAGLELIGLLTAIAWFVGHLTWITRSVILQYGDLARPLGRFSERSVYFAAAGVGLLLGVAVGGGTGDWLPVVLLDTADVRFGVRDPLLQADLGVFAAGLPFWELLFGRLAALIVPALVGVVVVAAAGGAIKFVDRRLWIARPARTQVALLLVMAALLVGWGQVLEPFRLAATRSASIGPSEFLLRTTVSQVLVLIAATAAALSFLWGVRFRFIVAVGGWVGLGLAMLGGTILIESRATESPLGATELASLRVADSIGFGIHLDPGRTAPRDTVVDASLWDRDVVARLVGTDSLPVTDAWPGVVSVGGRVERVWFAIRPNPRGGEHSVVAVSDRRVGPTGGIVTIQRGDEAFSPGVLPYVTMSRHHAWPGAPEFDLAPAAAGVALSSTPRRIALAWSLQTGVVLRAAPNQRLAWRLGPVQRLEGIAPFVTWGRPRVVVVERDVYWVSDGYLTVERFPSSRTVPWGPSEVGYVRAGYHGVVRARGGEARIYLRPDADSLAVAWARVVDPLIEPASARPPAVAERIGAPVQGALVAAQVLQGSGWLGRSAARIGRQLFPVEELVHGGSDTDPHGVPFLADDGTRVIGLLRVAGAAQPAMRYFEVDSARSVSAPLDLQQRWDRFPFFQQLRDSVRAAGSEFQPGIIRYHALGDTLVAVQPNYAIGPGASQGGVVLVNVALGQRLGAGRTVEEAWRNLRGEVAPAPVGTDVGTRLEEARAWLDRADAALKRGDLLEFGRAFAYLRELLRPGGSGPSPTP